METKLKELRKSHNLSQQEIADIAGISVKSYRCYENGNAYPTVDAGGRLAAYFNMYIDEIFEVGKCIQNSSN